MGKTNAKSPKKPPKSRKVGHDLIAERAYQIYLNRVHKGLPGNAADDWLQAEDELF